jgi:type I restriction enzyme S subunit
MELKPGYKRTEIGIVPEEWEIRTIGQMFRLINGRAFRPEDWRKNGTPIIRIQNLNDPFALFNFSQAPVPERNRVEFGDLLFAWSGTIGTSFGARVWRGPTGVLNQHIFKVQMDEHEITLPFSLLVFSRVEEDIAKQAHGFKASFVHVKKSDLVKVSLPVPPIHEQRAVAAALGDADALHDGLDRIIAKKRDLKQAAMQQLLTGQTRLPGFTGEWRMKRLGDHVTFLRNGVNARAELRQEGSVRYLHYGDVHGCSDAFISPLGLPALPEVKATTLDRLDDGDLIFADASEDIAGVGKSVEVRAVGNTEVVSGLHTIAARFDKEILADGFKGYLQFCPPFAAHLRRLAAGTKVYATNRSHIDSAELRLPAIVEQTAIATVLSDMDAELAALEVRRDKTRALKQAMMQELLTGRTRLIEPGIKANQKASAQKGAA